MIEIADAGEVKAKVSIEYNGEGIKQAKEDLASLAEAAGSVGQSAGNAGEGLSGLDEQLGRNAESARGFSSAIEDLPKIVEGGTSTISEMSGVLSEHQSALEETGTAYESFSENMQKASKSLKDGVESANLQNANFNTVAQMWADPEPFEMLQQHLQTTGQSWADFSASVGEDRVAQIEALRSLSEGSYPLLNTMSSQVEATGTTFVKSAEDMQVLNEAVGNSSKNFSTIATSAYDADQAVSEFLGNRKGFSAFANTTQDADQAVAEFLGKTKEGFNELGGIGESLYGPELPPGGVGKVVGIGDIFGGATEGMMGMLNDIAMPLMAIQMVGMAVQAVGQSLYDSAAIAEGPAAHSLGTFTGTVDALGQSLQNTGSQFSESFGRQIMPTLNALNLQASDSSSGGGLGGFLGGLTATVANLWQIGSGVNIVGGTEGIVNQIAASIGLPQPFQGPGPEQQAQIKYQQQMAALPQTVQANAQQLQYQSSLTLAQAVDPNWLAANNQAMASQQAAQYLIQSYDISHPISQSQAIANARYDLYAAQQNQAYQQAMATGNYQTYGQAVGGDINAGDWGKALGDLTGGIGDYFSSGWAKNAHAFNSIGDFFGSWWDNFRGINNSDGSQRTPTTMTTGCFVAGTPVLLADGREKSIEELQVGELVLAHDGEKHVIITILACIKPQPKRVYKLTFDDGRTLTTTNSHPIATEQGWKSLSPEATAQENPGLEVTPLVVGDVICTVNGTCTLTSILPLQGVRQIFNITVSEPHTFYASGVLVHNKTMGAQIGQQASEQIGDIQLPHMDLSGLSSQLGSNFSSIQLPHMDMSAISGSLAGAFSGITMPPIPAIGSEISGALGGMFSGITMPAIPDIGGTISGALSGMFGGISMPSIPDIGGMVSGALSGVFGGITVPSPPEVGGMISGAMSGLFGGVQVPSPPEVGAMINGAMSGIFSGIQIPAPPNLGAQISSAMSGMFSGISLPSVPFFAEGVSNFSGGPAVVGEGGKPELAEYNGQYALFDQGAAFVNLPAGTSVYPMQELNSYSSPRMLAGGTGGGGFSPISIGGGGAPQSINVSVHLDSQAILEAIGMPLSQNIRVASAMRSY